MNESNYDPTREVLLVLAAWAVSCTSIVPLLWAFFILGDYADRATDTFPSFVRGAAGVSIIIILAGALVIGRFWRAAPVIVALVAPAPYVLCALNTDGQGAAVWSGSGGLVFAVFYGVTHFWRIRNRRLS